MIFRRYGTFTGGIDLPDEKQATLNSPIRPCPRIETLRVPLAPCGGRAARLTVQPGRNVTAGQRIAQADDDNAVDIFAPLAGLVVGETTVRVAGRDGLAGSSAVELTDLSRPGRIGFVSPVFDWRAASAETLRQRVAEGGLTTHGRSPTPLRRWLGRAIEKRCRLLIANAMEAQPYVTSDHRLLAEYGAEVVRGLAILARCIGAREIILAADQRRTDQYRRLVGPARMYQVTRIALTHKYPTGADNILVKLLTRREAPVGGDTMDAGAAVIDVASCFATYRWVACGLPPAARVVTVSGERIAEPGNLWVPFGASCELLAEGAEPPVIHGGPMVGLKIKAGAVVGPATDAVLAIEAPVPTNPTPCIRCGWCTDHCPARLNVAAINDIFELGQVEQARKAGVPACVECGVCSYVCPARLPLSQRVKQLKWAIRNEKKTMPLFAEH